MSDQVPPRRRPAATFAALRHRNYRLWFFGQMFSLFGTWMQQTALGFLVYDLTGSPAYLGTVSFASGVSVWLFMLYGGVVADRVPRRSLLLATQSSMMLLALALSVLTFTKVVAPWHVLLLAFLLGTANAFDAPARQAIVLELVGRDDLTNAVALNATLFNTAVAVGPAVGGVLYAAMGPGWCFLINGLSFLAIIIPLAMMRISRAVAPAQRVSALRSMTAGLRYIARNQSITVVIALVTVFSLFAISAATLFPAWAVAILGGDARTNGFLQSARGAGALCGALVIASLGRFSFRGRVLTAGSFLFPLALVLFALMHHLPTSLALLFLAGAAQVMVLNVANAMIQTLTDDSFRGRVMAVYSLTVFGFLPVGALIEGFLGEHISLPFAVLLGAGLCLAFALFVRLRVPRLRLLE
jgi:MFS family permease